MQEALFCQALGLAAPWAVQRVALDVERRRIDLYVVWQSSHASCPACAATGQKLHDGASAAGGIWISFSLKPTCTARYLACHAAPAAARAS